MPEELIEVQKTDGTITIVLDGNAAHIVAGEQDTVAALLLRSPVNPDLQRVRVDADGQVFVGGGRASGIIVGFHAESAHGDVENATAVLDAERGALELSRFDPGGRLLIIQLRAADGTARLGGSDIPGTLLLTNDQDRVTVRLQGSDARLRVGGNQAEGALELANGAGQSRVVLDAEDASIRLRLPPEGGGFAPGPDVTGPVTIALDGDNGAVSVGGSGQTGSLVVNDENGEATIGLDGDAAEVTVGMTGQAGRAVLKNRDGANKITLDGQAGRVSAETGRFRDVIAIDAGGTGRIHLDGPDARLSVGFGDKAGRVHIRSNTEDDTILLNGATGNIGLGTQGNAGKLLVKDGEGEDTIVLNGATGNVGLGADGNAGNLFVKNNEGDNTIQLSGQTGDILLSNGDCAEDFTVRPGEVCDPGTVMIIDDGEVVRCATLRLQGRRRGLGRRQLQTGDRPQSPGDRCAARGAPRFDWQGLLQGRRAPVADPYRRSLDELGHARTCNEGRGSTKEPRHGARQGAARPTGRPRPNPNPRRAAMNGRPP